MPITLTIEALDAAALKSELAELLGGARPAGAGACAGPEAVSTAAPPPPVSGEPAAGEQPKKGRGRPRKQNVTATEAAPAGDSSGSQPAVEQNTGTAQAVQVPAADGGAADGGESRNEPASPAAAMTVEEFKKRLLDLQPADVDTNSWQQRVYDTLVGFGYQRVKEVKPEHYGAIVAKLGG